MKSVYLLQAKYVKEIIFYILLDIASFFVFSAAFNNDLFAITRAETNKSYAVVYKEEDTTNYNLNNKDIINIEVINATVASQPYSIVLRVNKDSIDNYNNIYVYYDNTEYLLSDLYRNENTEYYYFLLGNGSIEDQYTFIPFGIYTKDNINKTISYDIINEMGIDINNIYIY